ncbi:MAG: AAA family ATPase [Cyanobacteria bacterium J06634_5]
MADFSTSSPWPNAVETLRAKHHPHWLIGTLQITVWLLLKPSAWGSFIRAIGDSRMQENFCWAELRPQQRLYPSMRRLRVLEYGVLPVIVTAWVGLGLIVLRRGGPDIVFGMSVGWAASIGAAIAGSWVISVAASWIASVVGGLLGGLIFGLMGADSLVLFRSGLGVGTSDVYRLIEALLPPILLASFPNGVAAGVTLSIAQAHRNPLGRGQYWGQQLGGIVLGVVASALGLSLGGSLVSVVVSHGVSHHWLGHGASLGTNAVEKIVLGLLFGGLLGVMVARHTRRWWREISWGLGLGLGLAYAFSVAFNAHAVAVRGLAIGGGNALLLTVLFALAYTLGAQIAGVPAGAIAGVLGSSSLHTLFVSVTTGSPLLPPFCLSLFFTGLGLTLPLWLPLFLYPLELIWQLLLNRRLDRLEEASNHQQLPPFHSPKKLSFQNHPAFWDEQQPLPLLGLDHYLVKICQQSPLAGKAAFNYLSPGPQRWAVQNAQIELDARQLERCVDIGAIAALHTHLSPAPLTGTITEDFKSPITHLVHNFRRLSEDIQAVLNQSNPYTQRLMLDASDRHITGLIQDLSRSNHPKAARFRPIFQRWQHSISQYRQHLARQAEQSQTIESPYIVGIPLTQQQAIFVGRQDITAKLERLLRERRHSSFLLYGQRRMGKTSLLNNLGKLLPSHIVPLFIDLQGPACKSSNHEGFLYNLARDIVSSAQQSRQIMLLPLTRQQLATDPFTAFDEWLDQVETQLSEKTALLALDEFEALDQAITKGAFDEEAILSLLRNMIQHRPKFKVLLSGSHTLEAFHRWASYLINVQALHISYLQLSEAQRLIEHPVHNFPLHYESSATQRILALTRAHPFLVQLLCAEIIALRNEQQNEQLSTRTRPVTLETVEAAITPALTSGSFFFADIEHQQSAYITLLKQVANRGENQLYTPTTAQEKTLLAHLVKQEILEVNTEQYRFQVELIRRWFAQPAFS